MTALYGPATRASLAQPRPRITPALIAPAAQRYHPPHLNATVTGDEVTLTDPATGDRLAPAWTLTALATDMSRARVLPDQVNLAFDTWAEHRHATVADASEQGRLVLDWATPTRDRLPWISVVERLHGIVVPMSHPFLPVEQRTTLRRQALANSAGLEPTAQQVGAITLISATNPVLSTGLLTNPAQVATLLPANPDQYHLVITPGAPIACGTPQAIARLSQETNADHLITTWGQIPSA